MSPRLEETLAVDVAEQRPCSGIMGPSDRKPKIRDRHSRGNGRRWAGHPTSMKERHALDLAHVSGVCAARLLSFRGYKLTAVNFCKP